ncbi:S8 family serine peptidase [Crossiella sp. SN42]|uniref:S8 family peptidase n=1 Tax=Crossiella sp. SN42 TaxID=2944808 RepID=UPI00207D6D1C|nr:S8 family serine peptidase [Crossiella sp. SN42]MCO1579062.1 S8 family serine peptidase [Crossiella sp. SN42]
MNKRSLALLSLAALLCAGGAVPAGALSEPLLAPGLGGPRLGALPDMGPDTTLAGKSGPVTAFLELTGARGGEDLVTKLRTRDNRARLLHRTTAVAGLLVRAEAAALRELAQDAAVRSVRPATRHFRANAGTGPLTGAVTAWQRLGVLGEGVRIGIVDDGIDYRHADFGGPGRFPTAKVIGGTDLAGDAYDPVRGIPPKPDADPMSCGGHGTHVAGSAAGFGVRKDGSPVTDPAAADVADLRIGPGAAPRAKLYAIKVFGCTGGTELVTAALDRALDPDGDGDPSDRLDVVNLSLGSDFGDPDSPEALFVRKLTAAGTLVVASAGNGGDLYGVSGSPGNTPAALTVANSRDAYLLRDAATVLAPQPVAGQRIGQFSVAYADYHRLNLDRPVVTLPGNADGCREYSADEATAARDKLVWLDWAEEDTRRACGSAPRATWAQLAGAAGVLLSSTVDDFSVGINGVPELPVFQFTATGGAGLAEAARAGTLRVRLTAEGRNAVPARRPELTDTISPTSARGVHFPSVKPDLAAPGETIASAASGTGDGVSVQTGTSMSAPHVAGLAALLRQRRPDFTPAELKAALMNTAGADLRQGNAVAGPRRVGAGRVQAMAALETELLAYAADAPESVSVSFGTVPAEQPISLSRKVVIRSKGGARTVRTGYAAATTMPGARIRVEPAQVNVPAGGAAQVTVTLDVEPKVLRRNPDPTVAATQEDLPRQFLPDVSGRLLLTPDTGPALRVPVHAAPKPVARTGIELVRSSGRRLLRFTGEGLNQGAGSLGYRSLASVFELHGSSSGELRHVGATSTAPLEGARGLLGFGLAAKREWTLLGARVTPYVEISTTGDDKPEFRVIATRVPGTDLLVARTDDLTVPEGPVTVDVQPLNGLGGDTDANLYDSDVLVLPVSLLALNIAPEANSAPLTYTAGIQGPWGEGRISTPMAFDPLHPRVFTKGSGTPALVYAAQPGNSLLLQQHTVGWPELLVLHHHNAGGGRAQVLGSA